jgi:hypothetical protein
MEFRIVNRLHSTPGGEIIDASIQIVASIDASQACPTIRNAATRRRRGGKKGKKRGVRQRATQKKSIDRLLNLPEPESKPNINRSASTESLEATGPRAGPAWTDSLQRPFRRRTGVHTQQDTWFQTNFLRLNRVTRSSLLQRWWFGKSTQHRHPRAHTRYVVKNGGFGR